MGSPTRFTAGLVFALVATSAAAPTVAQAGCMAPTGPADPPAITGGDSSLSGPQPGPAPAAGSVHCWTGTTGDAALGAEAVATGDLVITLSDKGEVVAFPADGSEAFRVPLVDVSAGLPGGLTTDGERIYVGVPEGIVALALTDGSEVWRVTIGTANVPGTTGGGRPVVVDDDVYVTLASSSDGRVVERAVVALDSATGAEHWRQPLFAEFPPGSIAADADAVVLWDGMGSVLSFDAETGAERWRTGIDVLGILATGPVTMADGWVATILTGGEVVVLSAADGSKAWSSVPPPGLASSVTLQDGALIVNAVTTLYALDPATGEERWMAPIQERAAPFPYQPVPAVVDGFVILGTSDVNATAALVAWDIDTGAEVWRTPTEIFGAILSPIVSGGRVYAAALDINQDGGLFAFGEPAS